MPQMKPRANTHPPVEASDTSARSFPRFHDLLLRLQPSDALTATRLPTGYSLLPIQLLFLNRKPQSEEGGLLERRIERSLEEPIQSEVVELARK